jgi:hypothetical protein
MGDLDFPTSVELLIASGLINWVFFFWPVMCLILYFDEFSISSTEI